MKVLELFAGSRSIGKVAESLGHEVFSIDINDFENIDLVIDILLLKKDMIPFIPDMIWASPPCTYFSVASIGVHWYEDHTPKTKEALLGLEILNKTLEIFTWFPDAIFYMENPRGKMRKKVKGVDRATVTYCSYGAKTMKPTDVWSNNIYDLFNPDGWKPRKLCFNGNKKCHHEEAPRGSRTGVQGVVGNYERSKIPEQLCIDIVKAAANKINVN
jgi:site-specific DNA-cytosine methylase